MKGLMGDWKNVFSFSDVDFQLIWSHCSFMLKLSTQQLMTFLKGANTLLYNHLELFRHTYCELFKRLIVHLTELLSRGTGQYIYAYVLYAAAAAKLLQFSSVQPLSYVWLFAIPWFAAHQASLSITNSNSCWSSRWCHPSMSSSVMPFSSCPQSLPASEFFQWVNSSHEVAKVLEFQL